MNADLLDSALAECLALLESGNATLEECLERYPNVEHLPELLNLALGIRAVPDPEPDPAWFDAARRRLERAMDRKPERLFSAVGPAAAVVWAWNWTAGANAAYTPSLVALRVAAVFAVLALAGSTTVDAARDSTPGTALYAVRLAAEEARVAATFDPATRAVLHLQRARVRLQELERAAAAGTGSRYATELAITASHEVQAAAADLARVPADQRSAAAVLLAGLASRPVTLMGTVRYTANAAATVGGVPVEFDAPIDGVTWPVEGEHIAVRAVLEASGRYHVQQLTVLPSEERDGFRSRQIAPFHPSGGSNATDLLDPAWQDGSDILRHYDKHSADGTA
jgi:hypothetical protein